MLLIFPSVEKSLLFHAYPLKTLLGQELAKNKPVF